jgi:hypothetical protein
MRNLFAALAALSGTILVVHPNLALAGPPEPIKEQMATLRKSYSEVENFHNQMNNLLEKIGKNPSGWVFRIGGIEVPMTKELAAVLLNGGWLTPPYGPGHISIACEVGDCVCLSGGGTICYPQ